MAWYRFRVTFRRRLAGYLALAVLIGLVGGVAMAQRCAARRTDASYPKFLASTNPSDLIVQPFTSRPTHPDSPASWPALPHVRGVAVAVPFTAATLTPGGNLGTVLLAHVQLISLASHRWPRTPPRTGSRSRAGGAPIRRARTRWWPAPDAAAVLHLHVGSRLRVAADRLWERQPGSRRANLTVVGIGVFNTQVLQDGVDSGRTGFLIGTPGARAASSPPAVPAA